MGLFVCECQRQFKFQISNFKFRSHEAKEASMLGQNPIEEASMLRQNPIVNFEPHSRF